MAAAGFALMGMILCGAIVAIIDKAFPSIWPKRADEEGRFFSEHLPASIRKNRSPSENLED